MAGSLPSSDKRLFGSSSKNLLILISGASLSSKDFVGRELQRNLQKLCLGLKFYEEPSSKSLAALKEDKNGDSDLCKLVISLSKYLNLDELLCYDLLCEYLLNDQISNDFSVNNLLSYERHLETFMFQVWNFYRWERLYTLLSIRTILAHHRDQHHPYHDLFEEFLQLVDGSNNLEEHLFQQWDLLLSTTITVHKLDSHSKAWMTFLLQEQFELLQVFIVFFKTKEKNTKRFVDLLKSFIGHGFGLRQANGHLINDSMKDIVVCIGYAEVLILLENLFLHTLEDSKDAETYFLKDDSAIWNNVDTTIRCLGSQKEHGLVMLAWAIVRNFVLSSQDSSITRNLAISAQKLGAFSELKNIMDCSLFHGESKIAVCGYSTLYTLLSKLVFTYDESSIGAVELLWSAIGELLKNPVSAERFWIEGFDSSLASTLLTLLGKFPMIFNHPVNLLAKLAIASASSAKKVITTFQNLKSVVTPFSSEMKLEEAITENGFCYRLLQDYTKDGVCIRSKCVGYSISDDQGMDFIQWQQNVNGFQICLRKILNSIQETTIVPIETERWNGVISIIKFIRNIITMVPSEYTALQPIVDKIFIFVQKLVEVHCFDKKMMASILKLAAALKTKNEVLSLWRYIVQTGIIPRNVSAVNKWSSEINLSECGQGSINFVLASTECVTGQYSTLLAFLNLISSYANILVDEDDEHYLSCVAFVAREIFPSYARWWYSNTEQKEKIAQLCLKIFHNILKFPALSNGHLQRKAQKAVLSSLLHHDTGYSLLRIVCIGENAIQLAIAKQTSWVTKSDTGILYTVKLALSVLNRLLVVWGSAGKESSPLIHNLCSDPVTARLVMSYVNHRFDPRLATLGVQLLKQFARILPISLFVCLGSDAASFCRLILQRLQSKVEDIRLKLAVLELLESCVKFQPGITETILACNNGEDSEENQPRSDCLKFALEVIRNYKLDQGYVEDLHIRTLSFIKSLWISKQSLAIKDFKKCPELWKLLVNNLFRDDISQYAKADLCVILSEECLYKDFDKDSSGKFSEALDQATDNGVLPNWIASIHNKFVYREDFMQTENNNQDNFSESNLDSNDIFITAWKNFFIIATKKGILNVSAGDRRAIYESTFQAIEHLLKNPNRSLMYTLSEVLLHMSNIWQGCVSSTEQMRENIDSLLCPSLLDRDVVNVKAIANIISICIKLLFGLMKQRIITPDDEITSSWIRICCDILKLSALKVDTNLGELKLNKSDLRVVILISNMLKLLTNICTKTDVWHNHFQKNSLINILLGLVVKSLRMQKASACCCSILQLLSSLSNISEVCESIITVGTVQTLSMPLTHLQLVEFDGGINLPGNVFHQITWCDVYRESINLVTKLLQNRKHLVADIVMDFAGVHLAIFQTIPNLLFQSLDSPVLDISLIVLQFIFELSKYNSLWNLQTNSAMKRLVQITSGIGYVSIAYLLRPRLIYHLLGVEDNEKLKDDEQGLYKKIFTNDELSKTSEKLIETVDKLLRLAYLFISVMSQFSPDLCELLADKGYDSGQWVTLLQANFNTPSVDHITPPNFGTVISCVTVCLRILTTSSEIPASPAQTTASSDSHCLYNKELLTCLLERSLHLVLSQACLILLTSEQPLWDKEVFKRELGAELMSCIQSRYLKRSSTGPSMSPAFPSPASSALSPAHSRSRLPIDRWPFLNLISSLVDSLFK